MRQRLKGEAEAMLDIVGADAKRAVHRFLPLQRHVDARALFTAAYAGSFAGSPTKIRQAMFEAALELELPDDDWHPVARLICFLTDGQRLGHG